MTTVVPVNCRVLGAGPAALPSLRGAAAKGEFPARTVNLSRDGLLINSESDLLVSTRMELTLSAPTDGHLIRIQTEVAWSRRNSINLFGRYAAGLKIRKIDDGDLKLLSGFFKPV